jgi:hypothetical protein
MLYHNIKVMSSHHHSHAHDHHDGHDHAHGHHHNGHAHHTHGESSPHPPAALPASFMRLSVGVRLIIAALASAALWGSVMLAMT